MYIQTVQRGGAAAKLGSIHRGKHVLSSISFRFVYLSLVTLIIAPVSVVT